MSLLFIFSEDNNPFLGQFTVKFLTFLIRFCFSSIIWFNFFLNVIRCELRVKKTISFNQTDSIKILDNLIRRKNCNFIELIFISPAVYDAILRMFYVKTRLQTPILVHIFRILHPGTVSNFHT